MQRVQQDADWLLDVVRRLRRASVFLCAAALGVTTSLSSGSAQQPSADVANAAGPGATTNAATPHVTPILPSFVPSYRSLSFVGVRSGDIGDETGQAAGNRLLPTAASPDLPPPPGPALIEVEDRGKTAALEPAAKAVPSKKSPMVAPVPPSGPPPNDPIPDVIEAKNLFGKAKVGAPLAARAIGTYSRGCLSGGARLPDDGPAWQAMRLSRNRHWGHPKLVALVKDLAVKAQKYDGWPGLLVGDISQPRGGPMLSGHASHQIGLDADVWLTPMPDKRMSRKEREDVSATSMLDETWLSVDPKVFTDKHVAVIRRAAKYPDVERIFVHPAIKKSLCERAGDDRDWLSKVRPLYGHYYHFHIRIGCPSESDGCKPQKEPHGRDGCGAEVDRWLALVKPRTTPLPASKTAKKVSKPPVTMDKLPQACTPVLEAGPGGIKVPSPPVKTRLIAEPDPGSVALPVRRDAANR